MSGLLWHGMLFWRFAGGWLATGAGVKSVPTKPYAVGLAVAAMIAVAGCTGDPKPTGTSSSATPTTSTSAASESTTASSTSTTPNTPASASATTDPNVPAAARTQTTDGASAFTRYFYGLVNQAWTKPEAGLLPPLFTAACTSCQNFEDNAAKYVRERTRYNKTPLEILEVSRHGPAIEGPKQTIDVVVHQTAASVVDASGKSVSDIKEQRGIFVTEVAWMDTGWKLTAIKVLQ